MQSRRASIISHTDDNLPSVEEIKSSNGRILEVKRQHLDPNPKSDSLWDKFRKDQSNSRRGSLNYELLVKVASALTPSSRRSSWPLFEPATYHPPQRRHQNKSPLFSVVDVKPTPDTDHVSNWKSAVESVFLISFSVIMLLFFVALGCLLGYLLHCQYDYFPWIQ